MLRTQALLLATICLMSGLAFASTNGDVPFIFASGARADYNPFDSSMTVTDLKGATYLYRGVQKLRLLTTDRQQLDLGATAKEQAAFATYIVNVEGVTKDLDARNAAIDTGNKTEITYGPDRSQDGEEDFLRTTHLQYEATACFDATTCVDAWVGLRDYLPAAPTNDSYFKEIENDRVGLRVRRKF